MVNHDSNEYQYAKEINIERLRKLSFELDPRHYGDHRG